MSQTQRFPWLCTAGAVRLRCAALRCAACFRRYVLAIDPETKTMQGSTKGVPEDWRKATYVKDLAVKAGGTEFDHLH